MTRAAAKVYEYMDGRALRHLCRYTTKGVPGPAGRPKYIEGRGRAYGAGPKRPTATVAAMLRRQLNGRLSGGHLSKHGGYRHATAATSMLFVRWAGINEYPKSYSTFTHINFLVNSFFQVFSGKAELFSEIPHR
jgi:hypothetical protein